MRLALVPGPLYVGYPWRVTLKLLQPLPPGADPCTPRRPLHIASTWTLWADFFTGPGAAAQRIPLDSVVASQARGNLTIPTATTKGLKPGSPTDTTFPVHALLGYTDSAAPAGAQDATLGPIYFLPLDPSIAGVGP